MIRTFDMHKIRKQRELTGSLWDFIPCQGEKAGKKYRVATPCCWESHPEFADYRGEGIYRTSFEAEGTIRLEFKGVSHTATVCLDEKKIVRHYNAYTSFEAIVRNLPAGEHTLEIKADNRFSEASALHIPNDYMSYGGVSRPVVLEQISEVFIRRVQVTPYTVQGQWKAKVEVVLQNVDTTGHVVEINTRIGETVADFAWGSVALESGEERTMVTELSFDEVTEWNMESPVLYQIETTLVEQGKVVDDLIDRFGFREVKIDGKKNFIQRTKPSYQGSVSP